MSKWVIAIVSVCLSTLLLVYFVFYAPPNLFFEPENALKITEGSRLDALYNAIDELPEEGWKPVMLSDDWRHQSSDRTDAWYRFSAPTIPLTTERTAVYIPTIRQNVVVYVNGQWAGESGPFESAGDRFWSHPTLFTFSNALLEKSNNIIHLRLTTHPGSSGYLSPIYLGAITDLKPAWQWRKWIKVDLSTLISYFLIIVALLNFAVWALRPKDTYYFWFAVVAALWGVRNYVLVSTNIPVSSNFWAATWLITFGYGVVCSVLFNLRFFNIRSKSVDVLLIIYCLPLAMPMLFMSPATLHIYGHLFWATVCAFLAVYISVKLFTTYVREHETRALMLLISGIPLFVFGLRDLLMVNDQIDPQSGFISIYATPPSVILALWFMLRRFINSLSQSEDLNVTLDQRVREKEEEIKAHFSEQERFRRKQLLTDERERIMRDMHDGVGGHLVGIKALAENRDSKNSELIKHVERALIDLRFVINSMDTTSQTIATLLGSLRGRWQQLCKSKNIELIWNVSSEHQDQLLGPARTLHTMRILEEAFTNCMKHSGANIITISSQEDSQRAIIKISDNGANKWESTDGHGLRNMQFRADKIGAQISFDAAQHCFILRLG